MFKLLRKMYEWSAAKSSPRFQLFREGKELYLNFLKEHQSVSVEDLPPLALNNPSLLLAEEKYRESVRLAKEELAYNDAATGYYQLGFLYSVQGRYREAVTVYQNAIEILKNLPELQPHLQQTLRDCFYNIGLTQIFAGNLADAKKNLETAKTMNEEANDAEGVNLALGALSKCEERAK